MGKEVEIEAFPILFDEKMKEPQKYASSGDWKSFKQFFMADKTALMESFDLYGNTAIQIATLSRDPELLTQLLEMLSASERWHVLRRKNRQKNTLLHMIALHSSEVEVAEVVFKFEMETQSPKEIHDESASEESKRPLLELKNNYGETPVFKAAKHGNLRMLKHMATHVRALEMHFHRDFDKTSILHVAVLGEYLEIAIWLLRREPSLADLKDDGGLTCLQILSKTASAFRSQSRLGTAKKILYYFLPEKGYHHDDDTMETISWSGRDLESGENQSRKPISAISRINYAIWRFLAKGWDEIDEVWQIKKRHKLAEQLADLLVNRDMSWMKSNPSKPRTLILIPYTRPSTHASSSSHENIIHTPLLLAASTGVTEIVERIVDITPEALFHVSHDGQNILHVAIRHREFKIYELIKKRGLLQRLAFQISNDGRTVLHQAAIMDYCKDENHSVSGDAFELQDELQWFHRVEKILPPYYSMHCDDGNLTPRELFDRKHSQMLEQSQKWVKETAQSCSTVAVLVATVVFAAAYTMPGGYETSGQPVLLESPLFLLFTVMDIVALASSLASVVMFLSIQTSTCRIEEFYESLPLKLTLGFTMLFFSLTTTMVAFSVTILLTVKLQKKWTSTLIYSASFFPVAIFGLMMFPIYTTLQSRLKPIFKKLIKKVD